MKLNRRELCLAGIALQTAAAEPDWNAVRNDFPWLRRRLWISGADYHPIGIHSMRAMEKYLAWKVQGPGDGAAPFAGQQEIETKEMFARLINARSNEIAFVQSTTDGENLVVAGMRLGDTKGNVVIDDLHYQASKYLYRMLQKEGRIELRIVHHRGDPYWRVDPKDMEKAIDKNTRLVSLALVSNINGYLHDVRSTAAAAHAHGAYVYADIIQGAGAVPIDVKEMGIDFAACGAYKWLQGDSGFGFLYVREELQDSVVRRSRYGVRQFSSPTGAQADSRFSLRAGAARYETGSFSYVGGACAHAALKYIHSLGIASIRAHAKGLTDRLQKELPAMGYPAITPPGNPTPIVSFRLPEYDKTAARLRQAFPDTVIALRRWEFTDDAGNVTLVPGMRISPSVYNHQGDLDRLLSVLA
ncbi:MAG: aminotransferase class V-fold PLP-dependent enzyme [Bryobacteraceae bacterium]